MKESAGFSKFQEELNELVKQKGGEMLMYKPQANGPTETDKDWRRPAAISATIGNAQTTEKPIKVVVIGDGGRVEEIEKYRQILESSGAIVLNNVTKEQIEELAKTIGKSVGTVAKALADFARSVEKSTMKIENFRVPELNDIYITDQSLPRDAKGFGMSKLGINQRNNFKRRR